MTNRYCLPFPQEKGGGDMDGIEKWWERMGGKERGETDQAGKIN